MNNKLPTTLQAGEVMRFHNAIEVKTKQTVAQHSWGVAVLCHYLAGDKCSLPLILEAIGHDCGELHTGDVPATTKWAHRDLEFLLSNLERQFRVDETNIPPQSLNREERCILKLADMLEGMVWCACQNKEAMIVGNRWADAVGKYIMENKSFISEEVVAKVGDIFYRYGYDNRNLLFLYDDEGAEPTSSYVNQG